MKFVRKGPIDNNPALVRNNGLAPNRRQAIIWTNADPIHWHIYAALRGDELSLHVLENAFDIKKERETLTQNIIYIFGNLRRRPSFV